MVTTKGMPVVIAVIAQARGLDLTEVGTHTKIENKPWMALCVEVIGDNLVSVAHYGAQNGDLMRDPDCVYFTDTTDGSWVPVSFQNDYIGVYRVATDVENGHIMSFNLDEQAGQVELAEMWARNIEAQGFMNAALDQDSDENVN